MKRNHQPLFTVNIRKHPGPTNYGKQCRSWSNCSWRSRLILVYSVYPDLSVRKLRIITVSFDKPCKMTCFHFYRGRSVNLVMNRKNKRVKYEMIYVFQRLSVGIFWQLNRVMTKHIYSNNEGTDQPSRPWNLISAFKICCLDSVLFIVATSEIQRFSLASVAEQVGLSLTWSHHSKTGFSMSWLRLITWLQCPMFYAKCLSLPSGVLFGANFWFDTFLN